MSIPIGQKYTATVSGSTTKSTTCEKCDEEYLYHLERTKSGHGSSLLWLDNQGAASRAEEAAAKKLDEALLTSVDGVPCPHCGWYQAAMVTHLREKQASARFQKFLWIGLALVAVWGVLAFADEIDSHGFLPMMFGDGEWAIYAAIASPFIGGAWALGALFGFDPNHGYEQGKGHPARANESRGVLVSALEREQSERSARLQDSLYEVLRIAMLSMAGIDGSVEPEEVGAIAQVYHDFSDREIDLAILRVEAEEHIGNHRHVLEELARLEPHLDFEGKSLFVEAVCTVAAADGNFDDDEWEFMTEIGQSLRLSLAEISSIAQESSEPH